MSSAKVTVLNLIGLKITILFRHHCYRDPMRLQHACAHQCLLLRAVSKKQKFLLNEICTFSFTCRWSVSQNINLQREKHRSKDYERRRPRSNRFQSRLWQKWRGKLLDQNGGRFAELLTTRPSFKGPNRSVQSPARLLPNNISRSPEGQTPKS